MEIRGVTTSIRDKKSSKGYTEIEPKSMNLKPGLNLKQLQAATADNNLQEIVVKNDKGFQVIYAPSLKVYGNFIDPDGFTKETNLSRSRRMPYPGDQVQFGSVKGELVHMDTQMSAYEGKFAACIGIAAVVGAGIGAGIGFGSQLSQYFNTGATYTIGSLAGRVLFGGAMGMGAGCIIGGLGAQKLLGKPPEGDDSKLRALSR